VSGVRRVSGRRREGLENILGCGCLVSERGEEWTVWVMRVMGVSGEEAGGVYVLSVLTTRNAKKWLFFALSNRLLVRKCVRYSSSRKRREDLTSLQIPTRIL